MKATHYIIGCGGVGSWLLPALCRMVPLDSIFLIDGDKLERKNLDRQLFDERSIGDYKSKALLDKYLEGCGASLERYYTFGMVVHDRNDLLFVCADNHPARMSALSACDRYGCRAIVAANETHSAEAYYYEPKWKGTPLDPRVYYPEMVDDRSGDPRAAVAGCTGEAQLANPQLATANFMAAALALNLYVLWFREARKLEASTIESLPFKLNSNLTRLESHKIKDIK